MSFLHAAYRRCKAYSNYLRISGPITLVQNNLIAVIPGSVDYRLSFDIVPNGIVSTGSGPASILHFTANGDCCGFGQRTPAFWFAPGNTRLQYRVGDSTNGDFGSDVDALPLNVPTAITLECVGRNVTLTVGGNVYKLTQPTERFAGKLNVYAGDPWYAAAKAVISNVNYKILPSARVNAGNYTRIHYSKLIPYT